MTVWFSEEGYPAEQPERLLVRRTLGQEPELKYHRSNAPPEVSLQRVAKKRACRLTIEQDFQSGKGETGLDEYETRGWIGWHHHTALSMLARMFLMLQKLRLAEKRASNDGSGSARRSSASTRSTSVEPERDSVMEQLAHGTKSNRKTIPRKTPARRVAAAT